MVQRALSTSHMKEASSLSSPASTSRPTNHLSLHLQCLCSLVPASQSFLIVKLETPALGQCSHPPSLRFWATAALPRWPGKKPPATQLCSCSSSLSSCLSATRLATPSCFPICLVFIHQLPVPHSVQPLPAGSFPPTFKPKCIFSFQKTSSLNSTVTFCPVPNLLKGWSSLAFLSQLPLMPGKFGLGVQNYAGQRLTEFGQENAHWS